MQSLSRTTMELQRVSGDDVTYVESILGRNDLPHEDVASKPECFVVGYVDGAPVGIGGVEAFDSVGLLRSLVIEEDVRGQGYGKRLCDELETMASAEGIDALYLLTTTAAAFFRERGYEVIDRNTVPSSIQQTTAFTEFCPSSAVCMTKSLDPVVQ